MDRICKVLRRTLNNIIRRCKIPVETLRHWWRNGNRGWQATWLSTKGLMSKPVNTTTLDRDSKMCLSIPRKGFKRPYCWNHEPLNLSCLQVVLDGVPWPLTGRLSSGGRISHGFAKNLELKTRTICNEEGKKCGCNRRDILRQYRTALVMNIEQRISFAWSPSRRRALRSHVIRGHTILQWWWAM